MDPATRRLKLDQLLTEFRSWLDKERTRLKAERAFLQSVFDKSYGAPAARQTEQSKLSALTELRKYVAID